MDPGSVSAYTVQEAMLQQAGKFLAAGLPTAVSRFILGIQEYKALAD